ncbi:phycobiliprotein lyase (plasmid) [Kovacikia minuta CCNUW1]|uniref:phycobiliprotein lyase n=1 Tax=Kovacikia minuta TaxID=2931930 RepID=UPI001CC8FACA|nr:phycobiliprotein lyase [Kovacikia minuta]UBF30360.1 phycobiliprotein lyase [Kovacikia minuta CCNUW1]
MSIPLQSIYTTQAGLVEEFFRRSEGNWHSQRRYYTLNSGESQEVLSSLTITFLEQGCPELLKLAQTHDLPPSSPLLCGALTSWDSNYIGPSSKQVSGSTIFGVLGSTLYRDRGFATPNPVTAQFSLPNANTLVLRTQYNNSDFEEEIKLIGSNYRTRQTIISKNNQEVVIGQYLESRVVK